MKNNYIVAFWRDFLNSYKKQIECQIDDYNDLSQENVTVGEDMQ